MDVTSRREFLSGALSTICCRRAAAGADRNVALGVASYSFRELSFDASLAAMKELGLQVLEIWDGSLAPAGSGGADQRAKQWREAVTNDELGRLKTRFEGEGIRLVGFTSSMRHWPEGDIRRVFAIAKALGVGTVFSSTNLSLARQLNAIAGAQGMRIALHNHSGPSPDEPVSPDDFARAMDGNPNVYVNLDIGHFSAAGFDPVRFIAEHHDRILGIHVKDRRKNQGPTTPFGQGDTPIRDVLKLMREKQSPFPALIEYEYNGGDAKHEVRRCLDYCRNALAG